MKVDTVDYLTKIKNNWLNADYEVPEFRFAQMAIMGWQPDWPRASRDAKWFQRLSDSDASDTVVLFMYHTYDDDEDPHSLSFYKMAVCGLYKFIRQHKVALGPKTKEAMKNLWRGLCISLHGCEDKKTLKFALKTWKQVLEPGWKTFHPMHKKRS